MKNRGRLVFLALAGVSLGAALAGGCGDFSGGDSPANTTSDATDEAVAPVDGSAGLDGTTADADAGVCVPEPVWAAPDGGLSQYATCSGQSGIDLFRSPEDCGRCGHSCGTDPCVDGRCVAKVESMEPDNVDLLGAVGDDLFFATGYYRLSAVGAGGGIQPVYDFTADAASPSFLDILGGVTGTPGLVYVRTRGFVFQLVGTTLVSIASIPDNDVPEYVASTPSGVFVSSKNEILEVAVGADAAVVQTPAPNSIYVTAHANAVYWLEQPWNSQAGGDPDAGASLPTLLKRFVPGAATKLVHSDTAHLTGLVSLADGLYFMRLGAGGGVFFLPHDADLQAVPTLLASDDGLGERSTYIAIDDSHVYWSRPTDDDRYQEIWKRAKCGGASVRIAGNVFFLKGLAVRGPRLYYGSGGELRSLAK
jgi:hypothetical protein